MKKALKAALAALMLSTATSAMATPSTTYWTPATTYVQPYLVPHLTYDTYFGEPGAYPIDTGITIGVLPFERLQGEVGFDLLYPGNTQNGFQLNGKLAVPEGSFGEYFPGISLGVTNVGFKKDVSDLYTFHGFVAKTFPRIGNIGVGGYYGAGSKVLWTGTDGVKRAGAMAAWSSPDINVNLQGLNKIVLVADVMTGKNVLGAGGPGIYFYFTPAIDVLVGPVFFFDKALQPGSASMLWTVQLDVDFDLRKPAPAAK